MGLPFENADYNEDEVGARKIQELTDVVLTNIQNDNVLVYNNGIWENQAQSGGSIITELDDIPGVTITNAQDNQFLKYISGVWVNSTDTDNDTDNLNDLTDTLLTTPFGNDEVLKYLNGKWVNGNIPIEKLSNVHISNLQDGETLRYIHANGRWENAYNIDTLNELSDVNVSSNLNNHVLKYNNSLGVYKNAYLNVTDLGDTNITTLANGNTLIYNNGVWSAGNISYTETDPVFTASPASSITATQVTNWDTAYSFGDHSTQGYITSYTETDPVFTTSPAFNVTTAKINNWDTAYGWGDHAIQGYIKSYTETDPVFTASPASSITNGNGFLKNNGSGTWSYDTNTYLTQANIYDLTGLTWSNVNNNELIRRVDATNADGAGMTLHDTSSPTFPQTTYYKDISYFGRHGLLTIPFGVNRFESGFAGYNQRLIPYAPILLSTTPVSGLYLHHLPSTNDYNVRVGVNIQYPSQDFQVGTTLYVDDTNKRVGINQASPSVDLEVLNTMYVDSNTRKVGILNATPTTTFQVGTTLYVNETTGKVGIKTATPATELEVVGEARISNNGTQVLSFYDTAHNHEHGTIETHQDGQGGRMEVHVKNGSSGAITRRLSINETGSIAIGSTTNYGSSGQVLTSNGNAPPSWIAPTAAPATILTGSSFNVTVGTYPGNTNIPQLKANGNNDVHVFYADRTAVLLGHKQITSVNLYGGSTVSLYGDGANNVHVFYADIAAGANHLRGHNQITSVNYYGGTSVSLFGNGTNNVHVFYADRAGFTISDDRIKWNETPINTDRTIEIVKKIKFYQYDILKEPRKGSLDPEEPYDPSKCKVGFGVIAQEIEELGNEYPELKDTPYQIDEIKGVEYNNLFALLGATTQMLISRIETLENEVKQLKAK